MNSFTCPRCECTNHGTPHFYQTSGYTRCKNCRIGIIWESSFFERSLEISDTYQPKNTTISPKSGRVLGAETGYKAPFIFHYILAFLGSESGSRRLKSEGTLSRPKE